VGATETALEQFEMPMVNVWVDDDCPYNIETSLPAAEVRALIERVLEVVNNYNESDEPPVEFSVTE